MRKLTNSINCYGIIGNIHKTLNPKQILLSKNVINYSFYTHLTKNLKKKRSRIIDENPYIYNVSLGIPKSISSV
jgi:hypothetical protein